MPTIGVFLKGNFRAGGDPGQEESVLVVRTPFLVPKKDTRVPGG